MTTSEGRRRRISLASTVEPLADCALWLTVVLPVVPVLTVIVVYTAIYTATMGVDPGLPTHFSGFPLGLGGIVALGVVYRRWDRPVWDASALFEWPSTRELLVALGVTALGLGIGVGTNVVAVRVGLQPHELPPATSRLGAVALLFGSVVVAPVAEEVLFRGLLFGSLVSRGYGIASATLLSVGLFVLIHVPDFAGVATLVFTASLGGLYTGMRIRYDNLTGAWLSHLSINVVGFLTAVGVVPIPW